MAQVCNKCSHVNPPEAVYCYWDGAVLGGHGGHGGPVNAGSAPFPGPFVFPTGQQCRNFDQLAMACQQNWTAAVSLLKQGYLASFLGGLGRVDLAMAAQEAARYPDQDRGLDQLLAKLPSQVLQPPKIKVEPADINLGVAHVGSDRHFDIQVANQGMRLLYGSVVSDCKWLTLGEGPGNAQKLFQFGDGGTIQVHVRGQHLRAGNKPLEGHLVVESNGGQTTITVRVEVPVRPFQSGVLAGAVSPRQIAEKAKAQPKEAAALFERGAVAKWFKDNGWTYPVQGPSAHGLGAVQQFFEALGLATAPKVEVTERSLALQGNVGQTLQTQIEVKTQEKRPVYAHATCDQSWVDVSKTTLNGRFATITVVVPGVPNCPGQTLQANINITANGNQRFVVPLSLTVLSNGAYVPPAVMPAPLAVEPAPALVQPAYPQPVFAPPPLVGPAFAQPVYPQPVYPQSVQPVQPLPAVPMPPPAPMPANPFDFAQPAPVAPAPAPFVTAQPVQGIPVSPVGVAAGAPMIPIPATPGQRSGQRPTSAWAHLAPAGVLLLVLLVIMLFDLFGKRPPITHEGIEVDKTERVRVFFADGGPDEDGKPWPATMTFGVVAFNPSEPRQELKFKKLTYDRFGRTNSTIVHIDGVARRFGWQDGRWEKTTKDKNGNPTPALSLPSKWAGGKKQAVWMHPGDIQVTQTIEVVPGEPAEVPGGKYMAFLDTALVRYTIENKGQGVRKVGLRIMIDTLIGIDASNDGVPFTVPGEQGLVDKTSSRDFGLPGGPKVPGFIQVLEYPDLKNPGVIAFLNLNITKLEEVGLVEPPTRVSLTAWPGGGERMQGWEIPVRPFGDDSAVVLYWDDRELEAGKKRELAFTYGLGSVSSDAGKLGIAVGGDFIVGGELTVVGLVSEPQPGQTLELKLPASLKFADNETATKPVPQAQVAGRPVPVTWRVRSTQVDPAAAVEIRSSTGVSQRRRIQIKREPAIFGG
ncbi:MAG: hypothetical protein L0Z62_19115 [Gemmataceae bacterium]|nr:hypothetical protein [Gemmataceae bacterium]